ncbi:hypothetical protein GDO78_008026 [Eleutherodactylus coqui]|uniref:FHA domain-containing protein n=1 Tax=Eleutherodactylus coqui TaxID=57060 RepID=A0A8J6KAL1_ELECQ|nr:hypothetical protein GDO78_008026 [Eleutherodactylus coqui]
MPLHGEIVVIKRNGSDGTHFPLTATTCLFGRKTECDIRIHLPHVSKEHCKVEVKGNGEVFVTNLSAVNPTQVNQSAVKQPVRLQHGDIITIIDRSFRFEKPPAQQGKRRSAGLDSDTFKVFASTQPSDTNQTVRIESLTSKSQRKSEGNIIRTTQSRRSLQISSSSEPKNDLSPFGELYEMLKSKVASQNGKTPVKEKGSSPKNVALKRSLQTQDSSQSPVSPKRNARRSQSNDSPVARPKEVVEPRSASAGRVREASKSPSRSPKTSTKTEPFQGETEQTKRRNSSKRDSQTLPQEQITPSVNGGVEKRSPRRSGSQVLNGVAPNNTKTDASSTPRRRSSQPASEQPIVKNLNGSPRGRPPSQGRLYASLDKSPKATPNKPSVTESKTSAAELKKSPRKRRSDELSLPDPPPKRKRVSFGGHLSPELFDKRLPPNSPLKKGATPARRSLLINSPLTVVRKSLGLKKTVIREIFEQSESSSITPTTPTRASKSSPARSSSAKGSPTTAKPSAKCPSPTVSQTSAALTPVKNLHTKKSPVKMPIRTSIKLTPVKKSPSAKSPVKSPSIISKRSPVAKTPTTAKRSPMKKTPSPVARTPAPAKRSPVAKTPTSAKRSPVRKTPSPAKKTPVAKTTPSPVAKRSPVKKMPSPVAKAPTPAKRSPVAKKTPSPAKAKTSPVKKTPSSVAKRSPVKKTPSLVAKTPTPPKRSPVAKTPTPAKRSPVTKMPLAAKRSLVKKTPSPVARTPTPAKRSPVARTPTPAKRSPVARTPTPATPTTPYARGRFSISRIDTPPEVQVPTSQTPRQSRKSLTVKKTPRRSRKLEAFELIRSRRRSGATEANLLVSRTWADVVKIGVAKSQKKIDKRVPKVVATKKKLKHKTPMKKIKNLTSTGHADSPATILVGRAHTRQVNLTGYVPKVMRNQAVKLDSAHNESFTGVAELFSTPENNKRKSNRLESSKTDSPSSVVVEMSVMQTPEEAGEMVVSPLNSSNTTRRKQYSRDAVSRLLQSPALPKVPTDDNAKLDLSQTSQKPKRASAGHSGIKRIMRSPKQKGTPVTDSHALRKLLRTPKESESPQASSRRSTNLGVLGIDRLVKTPKQKGAPVEDFTGVQRIMKTPKQKEEPVEDMIGIKRIMRTPKEKSQPVEDMVGIKRIMRTPKVRGTPVDDIALNHLMSTPIESIQSIESTRPIEEIFGIRNLIKTPPKRKEAISTDLSNQTANCNDSRYTVQSPIRQESVTHNKQEVKSTQKRGRPSKKKSISSLEVPKEHVVSDGEATSPRVRGRPSSTVKSKESASDPEVSSESQRGRPKATTEKPKESSVLLADSSSDGEVVSPRRRGRPSSAVKSPKESVSHAEVTSPTRSGRSKTAAEEPKVMSPASKGRLSTTAEAPKESTPDAVTEETSPRRRGRPSSTAKSPEKAVVASDAEVASPTRRGRPKTTEEPKESVPIAYGKVMSPAHKGRPSTTAEAPKEAVSDAVIEVTSPKRRGRPSSTAKSPKESFSVSVGEAASPTSPKNKVAASVESVLVAESSDGEVASPKRRGRPSTVAKSKESLLVLDAKVTSPTRRGRPKTTAEEPKEPVPIADGKVTSPVRKGRHSITTELPKESVSDGVSETTSPKPRGRPSSTPKSPKESLPASGAEVTSPTRRGRSKTTTEEPKKALPVDDGKVTSPARKGRPSTTADTPKESISDTVSEVTSPGRRGRPSSITKSKESLSTSDTEVTSPTRHGKPKSISQEPKKSSVASDSSVGEVVSPRLRGRPSSTAEAPKESLSGSEAEVASPTRRGRPKATVEKPKESVPISDSKVVSPSHKESLSDAVSKVPSPRGRGRPSSTTKSLKESLPGSDAEVTSPKSGRPKTTADESKASVPNADGKVTSPARKGRSSTTAEPPKESVSDAVSEATSPRRRGRPSSTDKSPKESLSSSDAEVTSPTKRGRPKATAEKPKESVPVAESKMASPTRKGKLDTSVEVSKESVDSDVRSSRRRGRPTNSAVILEPVAVSDVTAPTRRGRPVKSTIKTSEKSVPSAKPSLALKEKPSIPPEISKESDRGTPPARHEIAKEPIPVVERKTVSQTRRGRQKDTVDLPQVPSAADVQVTRGSRSKGVAEAPKDSLPVLNDVAISQKRRGRPKVADVTSEATAPTRSSRSKDTAGESAPAKEEVTSQKSRGRLRKADTPKESAAVSEVPLPVQEVNPKSTENVASPTRKGRSRTAEVPKENAAVSVVASPKRRKLETTEGELDLSQRTSEEENEKAAKSTKKTGRQNLKKSSKQNAEDQQVPEPEELIASGAESKTQLPSTRGRRKGTQNEPVSAEGVLNSSLKDEHPERLTAQTSPVARRGGRRRNTEETSTIEPDVAKPKTSRLEAGSRIQSKSKDVTEDVREILDLTTESVKSPEPKSPKKSARQAKNPVTELPLESQSKSLRGRSNKKDNSPEKAHSASSETEASQKEVPARGRPRIVRDISNVSVSNEQTKESSAPVAKPQRGSRRNQTLSEEQTKPVASVDAESPTRGTRGKKAPDSSELQSSPEVKGRRNARGKTVQNLDEQTIPKSKTKSVQWHPLLATDVQSTAEVSTEDSSEVSTRGGRSKAKAKLDTTELQIPAKRSRRGNVPTQVEETAVAANPEPLTISDVAPPKRGRKANVQQKGEDTGAKSASESTDSTEVVHTSPQRGRRGTSSRAVITENNEPSTARRQRGASAIKTTPENENTQSPVKLKTQKGSSDKTAEIPTKSRRGVKRKLPNSETESAPLDEPEKPPQISESVLVETENIPAGRGRRNAKTQKGEDVQEAVPKKQTLTSVSPPKRRKTEMAPTAAQKKNSRQQTSKLENEKPSAATRTRTSTRSRK